MTAEQVRWGAAELGSTAEARTLLAHVLGVEPSQLPIAPDPGAAAVESYRALVGERRAGRPLQYLTGTAYFRGVAVRVGPGVFVPRPETEVMTGWALERLAEVPGTPRVVELCAGSGAIHAESPGCAQYAVELSDEALAYAVANLAGTGVDLRGGDMADSFPDLDGTVDLVIANPPYIPLDAYEQVAPDVREHEPAVALFSGSDGLDAMRVVERVAARLLKDGGWVCAEHAEAQADEIVPVFGGPGAFVAIRDHRDLTGRPRFVTARRVRSGGGRPATR